MCCSFDDMLELLEEDRRAKAAPEPLDETPGPVDERADLEEADRRRTRRPRSRCC